MPWSRFYSKFLLLKRWTEMKGESSKYTDYNVWENTIPIQITTLNYLFFQTEIGLIWLDCKLIFYENLFKIKKVSLLR